MKSLWFSLLSLFLIPQAFSQIPIQSTPVFQYQCRLPDAQVLVSYFLQRMPPQPIPYSPRPGMVCHDVNQYGRVDDILFPRLNQRTASFKLWDSISPYFYDNDGDGYLDIHNMIVRDAQNYGMNIPLQTVLFQTLKMPDIGMSLGYIMPAFIDQSTFRAYCPQAPHYNSYNVLFRVLGNILQTETEGLYMGQRLRGFGDFAFVGERELKRSWFYLRNGVRVIPTNADVANNIIYFTHDGEVFRLKGLNEVSWSDRSGTMTPDGHATHYPAHDRRIGCVPKF
ncbi:MAG: hypothetical protein H0V66_04480 [Bdellovibrionales bacterium]|nr:hypothetical protein [Bdellovibrionales bacterium]